MTRLMTLPIAFLTLVGCSSNAADCPEGFARDNSGNCVQLGGGDTNSGGNDGGGNDGGGNDGGGDNNDGGNSGNPVGDACRSDDDCSSDLCVFQYGDDISGVCTESCNSWSDCSESFWECCDLSNGGFVCTPDSWVDEFDLQCN